METADRNLGTDVDPRTSEDDDDAGTDVVESDKDLLRGGSGEQGRSRHPATDEDLLHEGSGWRRRSSSSR